MKATLRKSGKRMVTVRIEVHIGFEDVVLALMNEHGLYNWDLKEGRTKTWALVRKFMEHYGAYGWANVSDELRDQFGRECAQRARELFPDLVVDSDLREWNLLIQESTP